MHAIIYTIECKSKDKLFKLHKNLKRNRMNKLISNIRGTT